MNFLLLFLLVFLIRNCRGESCEDDDDFDDDVEVISESEETHLPIMSGDPVSIEDVPYYARLQIKKPKKMGLCGSSILTDRYLLSAAHCFRESTKGYAVVGSDNVKSKKFVYDFSKVVIHEKYNREGKINDIAVVKLNDSIKFGPRVRTIQLAPRDFKIPAFEFCRTVGFGHTESGNKSKILLQAYLPYFPNKGCVFIWEKLVESQLCAGLEHRKGSAQGDSGGPLVYKGFLVGLTAYGSKKPAQRGIPTVYTRVSYFRKWIFKQIGNTVNKYRETVTENSEIERNKSPIKLYLRIV